MSNRQDDALPELPESGMSEKNPYLDLGPMGPHGGKQVLHWYDADQMRAYAQSAIASLQARLDAAEKDAERYRWLRDSATAGDWVEFVAIPAIPPDRFDAAIDASRSAE